MAEINPTMLEINNNNNNNDEVDEVDRDNERHRREEFERRAKRHKARDDKTAGNSGISEKERKRREHAARILGAQKKKTSTTKEDHHHRPSSSSSSATTKPSPPPPPSSSSTSSVFQSLFAERALGFSISFAFRNAPPRPPVGPTFVGLGLEGELQKWTNYYQNNSKKSNGNVGGTTTGSTGTGGMIMNAVEKNYHWKLHSDLLLWNGTLHRQLLPGCAMDYEKCYTDNSTTTTTTTNNNNNNIIMDDPHKNKSHAIKMTDTNKMTTTTTTMTTTFGGMSGNTIDENNTNNTILPPEDEALIHWKGSMGDTAMEILTTKQERARAAARLAMTQGDISRIRTSTMTTMSTGGGGGGGRSFLFPTSSSSMVASSSSAMMSNPTGFRLKKKHHLQSRILDEKTPNFMKKTTYLTNDVTSVHKFTSLASTHVQRAKDMDMAMKEKRENYNVHEAIERGFREANTTATTTSKKRTRVHPMTKKEVYALWDVPLLPDTLTWGHTLTHVVMDNPPKNVSTTTATAATTATATNTTTASSSIQLLNKAIVADVSKPKSNARMECTVWVPSDLSSNNSSNNNNNNKTMTTTTATTTTEGTNMENTNEGIIDDTTKKDITTTTTTNTTSLLSSSSPTTYSAIQKYDLDVIPLRDPTLPPVHHVWTIYHLKKNSSSSSTPTPYAGYHTIGSRVQLSLGRPVVVTKTNISSRAKKEGDGENTKEQEEGGKYTTTAGAGADGAVRQVVSYRNLNNNEKKELEMKWAEVDVMIAEKYGL